MIVIGGRLTTGDLQTALSCFFFFAPLCRFFSLRPYVWLQCATQIEVQILQALFSLSVRVFVCRSLQPLQREPYADWPQRCVAVWLLRGAEWLLSLVLTAVHARHGGDARSRRIGRLSLGVLRVGVLLLLLLLPLLMVK